jgi:hypothetical protein
MECDSEMARCVKFKRGMETVFWRYLEIQSNLQKTATQTTIIRFDQRRPSILVTEHIPVEGGIGLTLKKYIIFTLNILLFVPYN